MRGGKSSAPRRSERQVSGSATRRASQVCGTGGGAAGGAMRGRSERTFLSWGARSRSAHAAHGVRGALGEAAGEARVEADAPGLSGVVGVGGRRPEGGG